ncbi:hypothetical protein ASD66_10700 [Nocardioides sp. Root151]|nr:hypothetical protein ASD66_10700 [Nocardioides sp. Root151]
MIRSLVVVTMCLLSLMPSSAHAADELGVSRDGRTWADHLDGSLFDSRLLWVPGDVRTAAFYVRNQADDAGTLTISVESRDPDRLLRDDDLRIETRVGDQGWVALEQRDGAHRWEHSALPAGDSRRVQVRASFDPASANDSQRDHVGFRFMVTLADADAGAGPGDDGGDGLPGAGLPDTGAPAVGWTLVVAGIAIGTGLALMKRGRRGETGHGTAR